MGKFLILWQMNMAAPWPTDPKGLLEFDEKLWAGMDNLMKTGLIKEIGTFLDTNSGYAIGEGDSADIFKTIDSYTPFFTCEVQEIISFEKSTEIWREGLKAQIEAK